MNKHFRKLLVLSMVIVMMFSMSAVAFADEGETPTPPTSNLNKNDNPTGVTSINLIKDYVAEGNKDDENNFTGKSPEETFTFTIEPYGVWNAGTVSGTQAGDKYSTKNMPAIGAAGDVTAPNTITFAKSDEEDEESVDNKTTLKVHANAGAAGTKLAQKLSINDYNSIGDFWYKVTENDNMTTGVIYTTNDAATEKFDSANNAHAYTYYIHVQILNNPDYKVEGKDTKDQKFIKSVTLHKEGPKTTAGGVPTNNADYNAWVSYVDSSNKGNYANSPSIKVDNIQNKYNAGSLSITKAVEGNAGDKDKRFEVTVTFTKPEGSIITSDITYEAAATATADEATEQTIKGQDDASSTWMNDTTPVKEDTTTTDSLTNTVKIYIKDGETVTFNNIPYGVSYKVIETRPDDDTYTNKIAYTTTANGESKFDGKTCIADTVTEVDETKAEKDFEENATGSITDASDAITITNTKNTAIDVGVILENAPYVAMLLIAGAAVVIFARRKSVTEE